MELIRSIPIISSDGEIEIDSNDLPRTQDLLPLLKSAPNPLSKWILLAKLYHDKGDDTSLFELLQCAIPSASLDYDNSKNDRLVVYNMTALYYLTKANQSLKVEEKSSYLEMARNIITSSEVLANINKNHIIASGYLSLLSGKESWSHAEDQFKLILEQDPTNFVGIMGMGYLYLYKKDYSSSLSYFRKALQICPKYANDARYGIGVCQYKLGHVEDAKIAFQRTITIDPNHVGALLSLAIIKTTTFDPQSVKEAMGYFKKVYDINKRHPTSLNYLANHFFFNKDYEKAKQLASVAFENSDNDFSKSESSFQIGRVFHVQGDIAEAFQNYHKAIRFNKSHHMASYNLGQIHISRKDFREACDIFTNLSTIYPNDLLTKIITLYLNIILSKNPDSLSNIENELQHMLNSDMKDIQLVVACADVLFLFKPQSSITYYLNAIASLDKECIDVPFELYNNVAACYFKLKDYDHSLVYLNKAYHLIRESSSNVCCEFYKREFFNANAALCRIKYNIGRCHEMKHDYQEALSKYLSLVANRGIKSMDVAYADAQTIALAMIRIGNICSFSGNAQEMINWITCSRVIYQDDICPSAYYLGNYFYNHRDLLRAQQQFEIVLKMPKTANDIYSLVALGNIWLKTASNLCSDSTRRKRLYLRALNYFKKVLELNPRDIFAANGIGCILAYQGSLREARDIFSLLRESDAAHFPFIFVNLGNVHFKLRHFIVAIQMYTKALEYPLKAYDIAKINFYIARAYFFEKQYDYCIEKMCIALHLFPSCNLYLYNMSLALLHQGIATIRDDKASVAQVNSAISQIQFALRVFTFMSTVLNFETGRCELQIKLCNDTLNQSHIYIQRSELKEKEDNQNKQKHHNALEEIRIRSEAIKIEQMKLEEKKRLEIEQRRKLFLQNIQSKLQSNDNVDEGNEISILKDTKSQKYDLSSNSDQVNRKKGSRKRKETEMVKKYKSTAIVCDSSISSTDEIPQLSTSSNNTTFMINNDVFPMDISSDSNDEKNNITTD